MAGHAARDRVNRVLHRHTALLFQQIAHFPQARMLRLRDRHSVAGNDNDLVRLPSIRNAASSALSRCL